jgi:sugar phosphate isomerase/epimerase
MKLSVFTKPWKNLTADELGALVRDVGFTGIEFPLRDGYQAQPANAVEELPRLKETLAKYGVSISSVASGLEEPVFQACQKADVKILRIMANVKPPVIVEKGYYAVEEELVAKLERLYPLCEKYGVQIGVQHHYGAGIFNTMELRHLLDKTDPRYVGAIWDAAHSALSYETPEQAIDIIFDRLLLVNLKNAYVRRWETPDGLVFKPFFCPAKEGAADWARIIAHLKRKGYQGDYCMPCEYTQEEKTVAYIRQDMAYLRSLLEA